MSNLNAYYKVSKLNPNGVKAIKKLWEIFCDYHEGGDYYDGKLEEMAKTAKCFDVVHTVYILGHQSEERLAACGFDEDQIACLKDFVSKCEDDEHKDNLDDLVMEAMEFATCIFQI